MTVPERLQTKVLEKLHTAHPGVVRMKSITRIHVWWPGIDKKIEEVVKGCLPCQSNRYICGIGQVNPGVVLTWVASWELHFL